MQTLLACVAGLWLWSTPLMTFAAVPEPGRLEQESSYTVQTPSTLVLLCSGPIVAAVIFQGRVIMINEVSQLQPSQIIEFADSIEDLSTQAIPCALYLKSFGTGHQ